METSEHKSNVQQLFQSLLLAVDNVHALVNAGADITAKDKLGRCPVASAVAAGQLHAAVAIISPFVETPPNKNMVLAPFQTGLRRSGPRC